MEETRPLPFGAGRLQAMTQADSPGHLIGAWGGQLAANAYASCRDRHHAAGTMKGARTGAGRSAEPQGLLPFLQRE